MKWSDSSLFQLRLKAQDFALHDVRCESCSTNATSLKSYLKNHVYCETCSGIVTSKKKKLKNDVRCESCFGIATSIEKFKQRYDMSIAENGFCLDHLHDCFDSMEALRRR